MLWEEFSAKGLEDYITKCEGLCVLPMGVLEKHGDHLPLGTDMYIVTEIAKAASAKSPAVVFPYYFMGQILEAMHATGTIAPSHKLIMDALLEMCDEIHRNGFKKILLLSGHGGNCHFLPFFAQMFPGLDRSYAVYTTFIYDMSAKDKKTIQEQTGIKVMGDHAGYLETSLIMHLRPDLVYMDKVKPEEYKNLNRLKGLKDLNVYTGYNWYANYPYHFAGDPSKASKNNGKIIFDVMNNRIVDILIAIKADEVSHSLIKEFRSKAASPTG